MVIPDSLVDSVWVLGGPCQQPGCRRAEAGVLTGGSGAHGMWGVSLEPSGHDQLGKASGESELDLRPEGGGPWRTDL